MHIQKECNQFHIEKDGRPDDQEHNQKISLSIQNDPIMIQLKLYSVARSKGLCTYRPKGFKNRRDAMKECSFLAKGLSQYFPGHLVMIKTKTWNGVQINSSAKYPTLIKSILSFGQIPDNLLCIVRPERPSVLYLDSSKHNLYPFFVCLS